MPRAAHLRNVRCSLCREALRQLLGDEDPEEVREMQVDPLPPAEPTQPAPPPDAAADEFDF